MAVEQRTDVNEQARGLGVFLEVSRNLAETLDLQSVLQAAADGVTKLVGLDTAAVYLLEGKHLRLWATDPPLPPGFPDEMRIAPLTDHPHIHRAVVSRAPVHVPDMMTAHLSPAERAVAEARHLRTLLVVPLVADVTVLGAFLVGSTGEPAPITDAEVDISAALGNLAALAVKNAQLYEDGVAYAARLETTLLERERAEAERRKLQEELLEARKLESLGRLAGGVAHDFNNMLSVIQGYAELATMTAESGRDVRDDLAQIMDAAQRSSRLTRQLLAFARKQPASPRVLDLNETLEGLMRMLRRLIREEIELSWLPGADLWPVRIDPVQIDQVVVNLCLNARDSIDGVGRIVIETRNVTCDGTFAPGHDDDAAGDFVVVSVLDSGCGMDRETRDRIFEPFFTTKETGKGTGLGLATVYGAIRQNGGFIRVESEPGQGATFRVHLPRCTAAPVSAVERTSDQSAPRGGESILLVEDEAAALEIGKRVLEMQGYEVFAADRPSRAIRLAEEHCGTLQLLITDVVMPEMKGTELARRLRAKCPGLETLFISGYTPDVIATEGEPGEDVLFLQKPFSMKELEAKVREALLRRRAPR